MMSKFLKKPYRWAAVFSIILIGAFAYALLDAFVIPKPLIHPQGDQQVYEIEPTQTLAPDSMQQSGTASQGSVGIAAHGTPVSPAVTDTSYEDGNIKISIETLRENKTTLHVADIQIADVSYLKTAFANNTFGRNIKDTTSDMAQSANAIFAINGDYYGFRDKGFVLRNGTLYRDVPGSAQALVIDGAGNFTIAKESEANAKTLSDSGVWQILSFGPALVENGEIVVDADTATSKGVYDNPRTAIGQISPLHYIAIVADGRTEDSRGMSLVELAQEFTKRGCAVAYNLDGGGSSTMYFNGEVVNAPSDGTNEGERRISDIVYIGYQ